MLTETFCAVDDFCKAFFKEAAAIPRLATADLPRREQPERLSLSERMTLLILFHQKGFRNFKTFYNSYVCYYLRREFPYLVSYERFVALMPRTVLPFMALLQKMRGKSRGIAFIDSTTLKVCHIKRERRNKVFAGIAKKSASTMGWFFGFKLHLIVNDIGEILSLYLTPGNVDDRAPVPAMTKNLLGKLFGDKGYISKKLSEQLFQRGLRLITNVRSNMKNSLIPLTDKLLLRKRFIIETINDQLKNISQIEHTRHRSPTNFLVNLFAGLVAYCLQPKKPAIIPSNTACHLDIT
jgi:Transposase DDE domain